MTKLFSGRFMALLLMTVPLMAFAYGISDADRQSMLDGGYDHLLFLFGVVFFLTSFKDVAKFVTVFTMAKIDKAEMVEGKSMKEWKFTFKNPAEKDASKQTLYLFYSLNGNFIAANFTGK